MAAPKIQDYAIIGNGRSAALISNCGAIDWLCWPRFDSASIFAAILDRENGGTWSIRPSRPAQSTHHYVENTNVLETEFIGASGQIIVTDFMPVTSEENKRRILWPEHELVRQVRCAEGETEVLVDFAPRPDYGRVTPKIQNAGKFAWKIDIGTGVFTLRSDVNLDGFKPSRFPARASVTLTSRFILKAGDAVWFSLSFSSEAPAIVPPLGDFISRKLQLTIEWWRGWVAQSNYDGKYQREVNRSALVLKLLSYAPSGAIIAAPTTSLPEKIGGDLNWDYRFAWLRDAAFTVRALFGLGYGDDAEAFVNWLLHATRLTRPRLRVLYDVFGESPPNECVLAHLRGFADSRPVRIGNQARDQFQLDIYGEVVDAVYYFYRKRRRIDREMQRMLRQCGEFVCAHWREADDGMWEYRDKQRHYTHSRLMCWVALDRLLQMHARGQLDRIDAGKMEQTRNEIRREIEEHAWNSELQTYAQACGSDVVDANALLLGCHGFAEANSERMQKTHRRVREKLQPRLGLLYRDEYGVAKREGAFALCSFWEADFLARSGNREEAQRVFEAAMSYANDIGLFAEEIDPETGDALGNFPQAFTHLGVINAALSLRDGGT